MTFDDLVFAASRWIHRHICAAHSRLLGAMARGALLWMLLNPVQHCVFLWATFFYETAQAAHRKRMSIGK